MKCETIVRYFANEENEKFSKLLLQKWDLLAELKNILHLPYLCTVELQKAAFTLTDLYGCLKILDIKLNQIISNPAKNRTGLATKLLDCLNQRKPKLVDHPLMQCAIFLDPRFKRNIDEDVQKVRMVKATIQEIWKHYKSIKRKNVESERALEVLERPSDRLEEMADLYAELDEHYNSLQLQEVGTDHQNEIIADIDKYQAFVTGLRMKANESIHLFWDSNQNEIGTELYEVACIIFSVPPTQASVERSFSGLKFLFSEHRYGLTEQRLEDLMIIHLNKDLFNLVKEEDLKKLEENIQKK